MPSSGYSTPPAAMGVDLTRVWTAAEIADPSTNGGLAGHSLGSIVHDEVGNRFAFVTAAATIAAAVPVDSDGSFAVAPAGSGGLIWGVSPVALATGEYGWIQLSGEVTAEVEGSLADNALLSRIADSNGDIQALPDVDEGGATAHSAGVHALLGKAHSAESGGQATVMLY